MGYHTIRIVKSTRADTDSVDIHQTRIFIITSYQIDNPNQINLLLVVSNIMPIVFAHTLIDSVIITCIWLIFFFWLSVIIYISLFSQKQMLKLDLTYLDM
jgi:hypothetical protein